MDLAKSLAEEVLILRCQLGDRRAFAELIKRYGRSLRYFLRSLLGDSEAAEDVFQDTWLTVIRKIKTLKSAQAFSTWLYRIARNYAYKELKRKKKFVPIDENIEVSSETNNINDFSTDALEIHKFLQKLRHQHKEVLMLKFLEQMSYEQIAEVTNSNIGTVKSRIYYAKQSLKNELEA